MSACSNILEYFANKNRTRSSYTCIRKAFSYLHFARYSDISRGNLTLATTYYCLGRFNTALRYTKKYDNILSKGLGCIHNRNRSRVVYMDTNYCQNFCGRGLSIMEKMSLAVSYDFAVYRSMPLIPNETALEVVMMRKTKSRFFIPPGMYSLFLKKFCYTNKGNLKMVEKLSKKLEDSLRQIEKEDLYLNYNVHHACSCFG